MKKVLLSLLIFAGLITLITSCDNPELPKQSDKDPLVLTDVSKVWNHGWFSADDAEYQFIDDGFTKYVRYLPDSLNDAYYLEVKDFIESTNTVKAIVKYSRDSIREMGTPVSFQMNLIEGKLNITADDSSASKFKDAFTAQSMVTYEGVPANKINIPAVQTTYFSNMQGKFQLKNHSGWELNSSSEISIQKDVNSYWFAHVVDLQESNGTYDMLLCHESNMDPGVTGSSEKEPFINSQNTVWSRMQFTSQTDGTTKVEWSSTWYATPYEALNADLDMTDSINYSIEPMHYVWKVYFATVGKNSYGNCCVEKDGDAIVTKDFTSHTPVTTTWGKLYEEIKDKITIPEGKKIKTWWYTTNSITSVESSFKYELTSSKEIFLKDFEIYCELTDKPKAGDITLPDQGTFVTTKDNGHTLILSGTTITYDNIEYECLAMVQWQKGTTYNDYTYKVKEKAGDKTYIMYLAHYFNANRINVRPPKEFEGDLPDKSDFTIMNSLITNFNKQP